MTTDVFLTKLFTELATVKVEVDQYEADHLCYRVASAAEYEVEKSNWLTRGVLLHEALIGGRPIATFALHEPIRYQDRSIALVELPFPKLSSPYCTGWEHAEFVVPEGLPALLARYPHLPWDRSAYGKPTNPEVRLGFGNICAKFHPRSLAEVIREELG